MQIDAEETFNVEKKANCMAAITIGIGIAIATIATISVQVVAIVVVVLARVFAAAAVLGVISVVVFTAAVPLFPTGGITTISVVQHLHIVAVGTPVSKRVVDWVVDWVVDGVAGGVSLLSIPLVHLGIPACETALVLKLTVFKRQTSAGVRSSSTSTDWRSRSWRNRSWRPCCCCCRN